MSEISWMHYNQKVTQQETQFLNYILKNEDFCIFRFCSQRTILLTKRIGIEIQKAKQILFLLISINDFKYMMSLKRQVLVLCILNFSQDDQLQERKIKIQNHQKQSIFQLFSYTSIVYHFLPCIQENAIVSQFQTKRFYFDRFISLQLDIFMHPPFTQIQFYFMKTVQYSNLKTINIDSEIFSQESSPTRSKLPLQLLKSLAQRKRVSKRNSNSRVDRYTLNLLKAKVVEASEQLKSESSLNDFHQPIKAIEMFTCKAHNKTNPQVGRGRALNLTDINFMKNNQGFDSKNDSERQFANLKETRQYIKNKFIEKKQKFQEDQLEYQCLIENNRKINPYTQQQYSYITHKQRDQLSQIKKATRFRRMSSITKSYKIVTIQLAPPPEHHRRPSFQYSPPKMFSPTKHLSNSKKVTAKRQADIISPSPWQWGLQQGKDFLQ